MVVGSTAGPVRTCVGCRQRVAATELLRTVAAPDSAGGQPRAVVPDPRRRMPGRGAWVHRSRACVDLAVQRRAFVRALRVPEPIDPGAVREYVAQWQSTVTAAGRTTVGDTGNERSMKRQR